MNEQNIGLVSVFPPSPHIVKQRPEGIAVRFTRNALSFCNPLIKQSLLSDAKALQSRDGVANKPYVSIRISEQTVENQHGNVQAWCVIQNVVPQVIATLVVIVQTHVAVAAISPNVDIFRLWGEHQGIQRKV